MVRIVGSLVLLAALIVEGLRVPTISSRRDVLSRTAAIGAASCAAPLLPSHAVTTPDYAGAKAALKDLIATDENLGPTMVRLAWHSSGTYDRMSKTGGSGGGTIRFKEELAHGGNAGLDKMVAKLEPIKSKFPDVSYADLYVLAGATAIEAAGVKVPFKAGRVDALDPSAVTPDGRLPDASKGNDPQKTAAALRKDVFYRMGFDDKEIVVLSGAHALGRCHPDASGYSGPWNPTPFLLNNNYYKLLVNEAWTIKVCVCVRVCCRTCWFTDGSHPTLVGLPHSPLLRVTGNALCAVPCANVCAPSGLGRPDAI